MIQYEHYGRLVWVDEALKGKHREHCLCWKCGKFKPENHAENCPIANMNYAVCVAFNLVLPVYECPEWEPNT
ncbi:MAG: hypothetical protein EHM49_08275 [Deltaproteobacteria bacterium]|nr:MAG: hypothetical protein EHM49_08275 [Deltaproteobacteria bacterium]